MVDLSSPVELSFVFESVAAIFVVIGICVNLVNRRTKMLKDTK